jgi:hypothetical protein
MTDKDKLPVVTIDDDGHFRVQIAPDMCLIWWKEQEGDRERWKVELTRPSSDVTIRDAATQTSARKTH